MSKGAGRVQREILDKLQAQGYVLYSQIDAAPPSISRAAWKLTRAREVDSWTLCLKPRIVLVPVGTTREEIEALRERIGFKC